MNIIKCSECKYFSTTTIGMPYACWHKRFAINKFGDTLNDVVVFATRIDSKDFYCGYAEKYDDKI